MPAPMIHPSSLHAALPIYEFHQSFIVSMDVTHEDYPAYLMEKRMRLKIIATVRESIYALARQRKISDELARQLVRQDRKSTRLNSSHVAISYAVFCLKKKK